MAPPRPPRTPHRGHGGHRRPSLQGAAALGALAPPAPPSPPYLRAWPFSPRAPRPVTDLQSPPPPALTRGGGGRAASRPAASLPPHPLRGRLSSPGVCGHGPAAPRLPRGGLACPRPRAAQVSGHRRGGGGGCTSPDPLQPIPSDRTST